MIDRKALVDYLHHYLGCDNFNDYAPNGLQIEGIKRITKICTAVTASAEVIQKAALLQAEALFVHHGYFWRGEEPVITGMKRTRIAALIEHQINLFAYHLPLDCHPSLGNNACFSKDLQLKNISQHSAGKVANLLWLGEFSEDCSVAALQERLTALLQREPLSIIANDRPILRVALCTGAAQDFIEEAFNLGADAYLSGEISERTYYQAQELGIHYFACGHHATERYGIRALGTYLAQKFGLEHHFIDSDNPV